MLLYDTIHSGQKTGNKFFILQVVTGYHFSLFMLLSQHGYQKCFSAVNIRDTFFLTQISTYHQSLVDHSNYSWPKKSSGNNLKIDLLISNTEMTNILKQTKNIHTAEKYVKGLL